MPRSEYILGGAAVVRESSDLIDRAPRSRSLTYVSVIGSVPRSAPRRPAFVTEAPTSLFDSGGVWVPMMFYGESFLTVDMCLVQTVFPAPNL